MSKDLNGLLSKLDKVLGKRPTAQKSDLNELRKKNVFKPESKNNLVVFKPKPTDEDPFFFWDFHNGLQETAYWSVPCTLESRGECPICTAIEMLQKEDWKGNRHIWNPIRKQTDSYVPVINVESEATIKEGPKWFRVPKAVMSQLTEWIRNLEKGEEPFFSDAEPQKLIISYNKDAAPIDQYKVDKKNFKGFTDEQLETFRGMLISPREFLIEKKKEEMVKIVDAYLERMDKEVSVDLDEDQKDEEEKIVVSKLASFKK